MFLNELSVIKGSYGPVLALYIFEFLELTNFVSQLLVHDVVNTVISDTVFNPSCTGNLRLLSEVTIRSSSHRKVTRLSHKCAHLIFL